MSWHQERAVGIDLETGRPAGEVAGEVAGTLVEHWRAGAPVVAYDAAFFPRTSTVSQVSYGAARRRAARCVGAGALR